MKCKGLFLGVLAVVIMGLCGCENLRFAPSEAQKQIAYDTNLTAQQVELNGIEPHSATAKRLADGTRAGLAYIGMPLNPDIADYNSTIQQASADAYKRPQAEQVWDFVDGGLELALGVLGIVGGAGGLKLAGYVRAAQAKSKALREVVLANQEFLAESQQAAVEAFKNTQNKYQTSATKTIVTEIKA